MKKILATILCFAVALSLTACSGAEEPYSKNEDSSVADKKDDNNNKDKNDDKTNNGEHKEDEKYDGIEGYYAALRSRVTAADSTADSIKDAINSFLKDADSAGYGMRRSNINHVPFIDSLYITVEDGRWTIIGVTPDNYDSTSLKWEAVSQAVKAGDDPDGLDCTSLLALRLADTFPEIEQASIYIYVMSAISRYVVYTDETSEQLDPGNDCPAYTDIQGGQYRWSWNNEIAGVNYSGMVMGTSPKIEMYG